MKRIIFMFALVLGLSACDNTKIKLRAAQTDQTTENAGITKPDSLGADTLVRDTTQAKVPKKVFKISTM